MADTSSAAWVDAAALAWALVVGLALGGGFFGGLWWTVRRATVSRRPALLFVGSFALRTGAVLVGFYAVADGHWQRLAGCVLGFVVARHLALRVTRRSAGPQRTGRSATPPPSPAREAAHAPQP